MGISMVSVGLLFNMDLEKSPVLGTWAIGALLLFIIGFAMSAGPIIWVLCAEIFPLSGRDLGVTFSTATNWIVNAIVGQTFLTLLSSFGNGNTFLLYGGLNVLFVIFFLFFVPETKGVSLEKIETNLLAGKPLRKIGR
jgi:SP family galactose:H+ symporter-like MFS transporter